MTNSKLDFVNIKDIAPQGWLKEFLTRQMQGLTGHLDEICEPFSKVKWGTADVKEDKYDKCADDLYNNTNWWGYEQVAYWVDGYLKTCHLLKTKYSKVKNQLYDTLFNADADGYLGPHFMKNGGERIRWPHTVFFRALLTEYEFTGKSDIIEKLTNHYLNDDFIYDEFRDITNIEIMLYLYGINGEKRLLEKSVVAYKSYFEKAKEDNALHSRVNLDEEKPYNHGVTFNEVAKLGAILYVYTGEEKFLNDSVTLYKKVDKYFTLPNGCICSNEFMIDNKYYRCTEMCDVSDYIHSLRYMLSATGNIDYADKIELCAFNAGIGACLENFEAIQYLSCANQVIATDNSCHNFFHKGGNWMKYNSDMEVKCCLANSSRFMPEYVLSMFAKNDNCIMTLVYGAAHIDFSIGGEKITLTEQTEYPFEDRIKFTVNCKKNTVFVLSLRIPAWAKGYSVEINGKKEQIKSDNGFVKIDREWKNGDVVILRLNVKVEIINCGKNKAYFKRGSLVFSIGDSGERVKDGDFGSVSMRIRGKWNYAVDFSTFEYKVENQEDYPWCEENCPVSVVADCEEISDWKTQKIYNKKIKNVWNLYEKKYNYVKGDFEFTPEIPSEKFIKAHKTGNVKRVKFIPYGVAKMRMTVLPKKDG